MVASRKSVCVGRGVAGWPDEFADCSPIPDRGWRFTLMDRSTTNNSGETEIDIDATGIDTPKLQTTAVLPVDDLRLVVFIIRCARTIALLQRIVPEKYLPPREDRMPPTLLKRLIHELKKLIPKWKWTPSARTVPLSPAKLGDEFFYAITALRLSRMELWRAGYTECVAVLDDVYSLLFSIGIRVRERRHRSKSQQPDRPTQ